MRCNMINPDNKQLKAQLSNQFSATSVMPSNYGAQSSSRKCINNKYVIKILLSEELLSTAKLFLACDLNIAKASKQGFMHRNTLIYRLDVIYKLTGLDLRTFEDSVIMNNIIVAFEQQK